MPISRLSPITGGFSWRLTHFEHEVDAPWGLEDLKSSFGVDRLAYDGQDVIVEMSNELRSVAVVLQWAAVSEFTVQMTGAVIPGDDGRMGIIGLRVLEITSAEILFELVTDWLTVHIRCATFTPTTILSEDR